MSGVTTTTAVRPFTDLDRDDVAFAGGKGANLGELTQAGFPVPPGFVVGAPAFASFCAEAGLRGRLATELRQIDVEDTAALEAAAARARALVDGAVMPPWLQAAITGALTELGDGDAVAVRSSATVEDAASASFAGMHESFLNVRGPEAVLEAVRACWTSLYTPRTIFYRAKQGIAETEVGVAVVLQRQIAASRAGVMFTVDPASGREDQLVIEGAFGLGESVVSGSVSPDRYVVDKASLTVVIREVRRKDLVVEARAEGGTVTRTATGPAEALAQVLGDDEVRALARLGASVERHYGAPQDTEWAFDAEGRIWLLQSRPVTSQRSPAATAAAAGGPPLVRGLGAAPGVASGAVRRIERLADAGLLVDGEVLVTHMTAPDWVPLMRRAAAIVTDAGGMTCHAAIVSRELGLPCIVGTGDAMERLRDGEVVTVDAGHGTVVAGRVAPTTHRAAPAPAAAAPVTGTQVLVNLSEPSQVEHAAALDVDGVGLLRAELLVLEALGGVHPALLIEQGRGAEVTARLAEGLERFATGFAPRPVTYRTIDFRSNEFRGLQGGERFEPEEANPMIGFRGALRYAATPELLALELDAVRTVWDRGGRNLHVMLPFVRTVRELERCRALFAAAGLLDRPGFELWVMAEVPSVLFNLESYARLGIAGISIGTNDLTQLLLGVDRDSELLAGTFDERDDAVVAYVRELIAKARSLGLRTSICGQAPSVHPEYADLLVRAGIDAISVSADVTDRTRRLVAAAERRVLLDATR